MARFHARQTRVIYRRDWRRSPSPYNPQPFFFVFELVRPPPGHHAAGSLVERAGGPGDLQHGSVAGWRRADNPARRYQHMGGCSDAVQNYVVAPGGDKTHKAERAPRRPTLLFILRS